MATNRIMSPGYQLSVVCTTPTTPQSGGPVRYGTMTGIALTDEAEGGNPTGYTSVDFGPGVWDLSVTDTVTGGIAVGDPLFLNAAATLIDNTATGYFFGIALEAILTGATATIRVLHMPSPGAGTLASGSVSSAKLAVGALAADATGRAVMATDYFDAATVLLKIADGAFAADTATRALFADAIWTEAKLALASLTGLVVKVNATENVIGSIPVYHRMTIPDVGAPTDYSLLLTHKTLITNWWIQNTGSAAHNTDDTINLKNVAASLSGAVPKTNVVNGLVRPATLDSSACLVTAGTNLVVTATKATQIACVVHILGVRSA